ncbi:MAG TPA: hypothetical protein VIA45_16070 [Thermoanaerobaculia bacterium]|jgi:C-terminal processing protease CtpA/Prc
MRTARGVGIVAAIGCAALAACQPPGREKPGAAAAASTPAPTAAPTTPVAPPAPTYVSGLGELMALQQTRHAKLWFAGEARNWGLAEYEWKEIQEGFADIKRVYPTRPDSPVPIDQAIETMMTDPLKQVGDAIQKKDSKAFAAAFDMLTEGCNACHQASNHPFTVLQRPRSNPFPNQSFAPPK